MSAYQIGPILFDVEACEITSEGGTQHLQPQVRSVLLCLARHSGEVVSKERLVDEAWAGRHTSDEAITRCISLLRRHFEACGERHLIETIPKSGYRLIESAEAANDAAPLATGPGLTLDMPGFTAKTAVNVVVTATVAFLLLSGLVIASDFFSLTR
ncbi:hypothetical protein EY643_08720 [Halioglobus maricola]|uniref:OmpR/PhoB-type domain-containing protein n=1 Tax=Halioglobus maricola TaxID=2601894 RepID=A0A5P9NKG4_9GAMM|nr:winged helix-turn-helix domain-containing protein [Halioglobus maricola]QFU75734.1 hypothetical protein EY643_08720 [Halioglobus maricola]